MGNSKSTPVLIMPFDFKEAFLTSNEVLIGRALDAGINCYGSQNGAVMFSDGTGLPLHGNMAIFKKDELHKLLISDYLTKINNSPCLQKFFKSILRRKKKVCICTCKTPFATPVYLSQLGFEYHLDEVGNSNHIVYVSSHHTCQHKLPYWAKIWMNKLPRLCSLLTQGCEMELKLSTGKLVQIMFKKGNKFKTEEMFMLCPFQIGLGDQQLLLFKAQKVTKCKDTFLAAYITAKKLRCKSAITNVSKKDVNLPQSPRLRLVTFIYCALLKKTSKIASVNRYLNEYYSKNTIGNDSWFEESNGFVVTVKREVVKNAIEDARAEKEDDRTEKINKFIADNPDVVHPYKLVKFTSEQRTTVITKTVEDTKAYVIKKVDTSQPMSKAERKAKKSFIFRPGKVKVKQGEKDRLKKADMVVEVSDDYKNWLKYLENRQKGKRRTRCVLLSFKEFQERLAAFRKHSPLKTHQMGAVIRSLLREEKKLTKIKRSVEKAYVNREIWRYNTKLTGLQDAVLHAHIARNKYKGRDVAREVLESRGYSGASLKQAMRALEDKYLSDCAVGWYSADEIVERVKKTQRSHIR